MKYVWAFRYVYGIVKKTNFNQVKYYPIHKYIRNTNTQNYVVDERMMRHFIFVYFIYETPKQS